MLERRDVVGGAAVTEEFHPGFRNSVAAYTVSLLQPKVIRDLDLHAHGLRIVERRLGNFLPLPDGRSSAASAPASRRPRWRSSRSAMPNACPNTSSGSRRSPTCCARSRWSRRRTSPTAAGGRRCPNCCAPAGSARRLHKLDPGAAPGTARSVHDLRGRVSRPLVRERADQGGVRLRRHRRQLRQPVHAGQRLRAAASRVRRGQRRQGRLGPRDRRHGRDHPGDGARRPTQPASRSAPVAACAKSSSRTAARSAWSPKQGEVLHARAVVANVNPKLLYERLLDPRRGAGADARTHGQLALRLRHVPHERRAVRAAAISRALPGTRRSPDRRHHHGAEPGLHGSRLLRCARPRLVARADRRDADSLDARRSAWRRRASTWRACSASTSRRSLPDGRSWDDHREEVADLMIATVDRYAPGFKASVLGRQA